MPLFGPVFPESLSAHPLLRLIFGYSPLVYFSLFMTWAVWHFLKNTRGGLILRAVGENDYSAHSIGYSVIGVRYMAVAFGGAMAGIAGSFFSLVLTPMWAEQLTAGPRLDRAGAGRLRRLAARPAASPAPTSSGW